MWKEPVIGDKSLSCGAVVATERHLDVCVTPPLPRGPALFFSRPVLYVFFLIPGCTSGKTNVRHQPLKYVPQWHFTPRACVCVCFLHVCVGRIEITKMIVEEVQQKQKNKCFSGDKSFRDKSWRATGFSFPPCVDDLSCPDSVVLTACLCSFCHTKAKRLRHLHTTVSFHTMQNWNRLLSCRWIWVFLDVYKLQSSFSLYSLIHTCKSWSHRYGYIYILYFKIWRFLL